MRYQDFQVLADIAGRFPRNRGGIAVTGPRTYLKTAKCSGATWVRDHDLSIKIIEIGTEPNAGAAPNTKAFVDHLSDEPRLPF